MTWQFWRPVVQTVAAGIICAALLAMPVVWYSTHANADKNKDQDIAIARETEERKKADESHQAQYAKLYEMLQDVGNDVKYIKGVEEGKRQARAEAKNVGSGQ